MSERPLLPYRTRKRIALAVLLVGLPVYIIVAVNMVGLFDRPPLWVEFIIYVVLGIVWVVPLRRIFIGVAQPDPDAATPAGKDGPDPH